MCMQNMYSIANINRNMIIAFYETIRIPHTGTTRAERHTLEARGRRRRPNSSHSLCVRAPYEMKQKKIIKKNRNFSTSFLVSLVAGQHEQVEHETVLRYCHKYTRPNDAIRSKVTVAEYVCINDENVIKWRRNKIGWHLVWVRERGKEPGSSHMIVHLSQAYE